MYYDLNLVWPSPFDAAGPSSKPATKKTKKDAKGGAEVQPNPQQASALQSLSPIQREKMKAVTMDAAECEYEMGQSHCTC